MKWILLIFSSLFFYKYNAYATNTHTTEQVFRVMVNQCGLKNLSFVQSGFLVSINGKKGLLTALHGVVGCKHISASKGKNIYLNKLNISMVDIARDVAFLTSNELSNLSEEPLFLGTVSHGDQLQVIGFPQALDKPLSLPIQLNTAPIVQLADLLPYSIKAKLSQRNSPSPQTKVLSIIGSVQPGHSGAPILNQNRKVIGIANGGLAGGFADINWGIPASEINLQASYHYQNELKYLEQMDISVLFHLPEAEIRSKSTGSRVVGKIYYNGEPISRVSKASAIFQLFEVNSSREVPFRFNYDNNSGTFELLDIPAGKYYVNARLEAGYPFYIQSGGDFTGHLSGLNEPLVVAPHENVIMHDIKLVKSIHLKKPISNQVINRFIYDPIPKIPIAEASHFEWEKVPGASYYEYVLLLMQGNPHNQTNVKRLQTQSQKTLHNYVNLNIVRTSPDLFYVFYVNAYNTQHKIIGAYTLYSKDGFGGAVNFRVY